MLVLTRKIDEEVIVRDPETNLEIVITLVNTIGNKAKLGIHAPKNLIISRKELGVKV